MKDKLNRLQLELSYAKDELNNMNKDASKLLKDVIALEEENKKLLEKEDEKS
jgi:hypothetical protein